MISSSAENVERRIWFRSISVILGNVPLKIGCSRGQGYGEDATVCESNGSYFDTDCET